jgi:hypothetical protein
LVLSAVTACVVENPTPPVLEPWQPPTLAQAWDAGGSNASKAPPITGEDQNPPPDGAATENAAHLRPVDHGGHPPAPGLEDAGSASAHGGLPPDAIRGVVVSHRGALQACYELEARQQTGLQGGVTVAWTVDADGKVSIATLIDSTVHNARIEGCVLRQVKGWLFPASDAPTRVASFPFSFGVH